MSLSTQAYRGYGGSLDAIVRRGFASYTGLPQPVAAGFQYEAATTAPYTGSGFSAWSGASPAVAVGDVGIFPLVTSPSSFGIVPNGDGTFEILSAGDTSRQSLLFSLYRVASNSIDGPETIWDHEIGPSWVLPLTVSAIINNPATTINLAVAPYASSPEGDVLVFALNSGSFPLGVTLASNGIMTVALTSLLSSSFTISATDITGTAVISPLSMISATAGSATVPDVTGLAVLEARQLLAAAGFTNVSSSTVYSVVVPVGVTAQQNPPAGSVVSFNTPLSVFVSLGPFVTSARPAPVLRVTTRQFNLLAMVESEWGSEFRAPDHRVYVFGDGRRAFDSTDTGNTGIYQKP